MKQINLFLAVFTLLLSVLCACEDSLNNPKINNTLPSINGQPLRDGITRINDNSLAFVLFAPGKNTVHLVGDFNQWKTIDEYKLHKDGDRFWIQIGNLDVNKKYVMQYLIDHQIYVADPYTHEIVERNNKNTDAAMIVSTQSDNYNWQDVDYTMPKPENLTIYELHLRDFTTQGSLKAAQAKIPYLKQLGINAIELMPFNEFEGNDSWGYNPSFYFAPDKAYGTSNDYKEFIDVCHQNGMAVIMDMVLNHSYGQSPLVRMWMNGGKVSSDNPYYNVDSPNTAYSWGYDFNHESQYTQAFVDSVCAYWMLEYKIDGYRFDFTKGFTNQKGDGWAYDESRINILKRMTDAIWKRKKDAYVILEHLTDNSEEKILANYGIMLWGNMNYNTNEATMGWGEAEGSTKGDFSGASYKQRAWSNPRLIAYMESHYEERLMYKNIQYGNADTLSGYFVKNLNVGLQRNAAAAVIFLSIPGPKMIWQFGELGYDVSINYNDRVGRKPVRWEYFDEPARRALYDVYSEMNTLRATHPAFSTTDFALDVTKNFKIVTLKSSNENVVAMANLDVIPATKAVDFGQAGVWTEHFSKNNLNLTSALTDITLQPGEYRLYFGN
ncbi:MAG: alpha-amylase [Candidatus Symbiothrix sp.]|jgi:pullulanase/glycogen debranching enzyme|nr:alpha-amylase [Candidatus Symbiothrix sp.]